MYSDAVSPHDLSPNPLVRSLDKDPADFTRADLIEYIAETGIRRVHLRYAALDGQLKELRVPVLSRDQLDRLLADGERVDGSNPYRGLVKAGRSDLYCVPVYRLAMQDPFAPDALHVHCRCLTGNGEPLPGAPDAVLARAAKRLEGDTGVSLRALGELEFYLLLAGTEPSEPYATPSQRGYHLPAPYARGATIADEIASALAATVGHVKYVHHEVGLIDQLESPEPALDGRRAEQIELEFDATPIEDTAAILLAARELVRRIAERHGAWVTFTPKLEEGHAGSGMHVHMEAWRDGANVLVDERDQLSQTALGLIGGLLELTPALTAFGNTVAASYLRLTAHQEAPTKICWGVGNRHSLIRVPLAWRGLGREKGGKPLAARVNRGSVEPVDRQRVRQTIEYRVPDGSADVYTLLAGMCVAARRGLTDPAIADIAERTRVDAGDQERDAVWDKLLRLPASCAESADALAERREYFEDAQVFPPAVVDWAIKRLRDEQDHDIAAMLRSLTDADRLVQGRKIMHRAARYL